VASNGQCDLQGWIRFEIIIRETRVLLSISSILRTDVGGVTTLDAGSVMERVLSARLDGRELCPFRGALSAVSELSLSSG
jgi:hypothetical protein